MRGTDGELPSRFSWSGVSTVGVLLLIGALTTSIPQPAAGQNVACVRAAARVVDRTEAETEAEPHLQHLLASGDTAVSETGRTESGGALVHVERMSAPAGDTSYRPGPSESFVADRQRIRVIIEYIGA